MMSPSPNLRHGGGCTLPDLEPSKLPIAGPLNFHRLIMFIGTVCAALALVIGTCLMLHHAARCYRVQEQKYLMRLTWVIPAFAVTYTICCWYYPAFEYISTIPEIVEAFSFVSLFQMFAVMTTGTTDRRQQEEYFQNLPRYRAKKFHEMMIPRLRQQPGKLKHDKGSLRWFRGLSLMVYQFPIVKTCWTPCFVLATYVVCPSASAGSVVHALNGVVNGMTTTFAVMGMVYFYSRTRDDLKPRHAFRKTFIFKKMIGIILTQSMVMSFVNAAKAIHPTPQMSFGDYTVGIPAFMAQCEMFLFSIAFCFAYNVREFEELHKHESLLNKDDDRSRLGPGKTSFFHALWAMINISDFIGGLFDAVRNIPRIARKEYSVDGGSFNKTISSHPDETAISLAPPTFASPQYTAYQPRTTIGAQYTRIGSHTGDSEQYDPYQPRDNNTTTPHVQASKTPQMFLAPEDVHR